MGTNDAAVDCCMGEKGSLIILYRDHFHFTFVGFHAILETAKISPCVCVCFYIIKFAQGDLFALKALFSASESNWSADG